VDILQRIDI